MVTVDYDLFSNDQYKSISVRMQEKGITFLGLIQ
jgi:hypothetical protein